MEGLIPWQQLEDRIEPFYPKAGRGRRPYLGVMPELEYDRRRRTRREIFLEKMEGPQQGGSDRAVLKAGRGRRPYPLGAAGSSTCAALRVCA